jgi:hypothetical protein
MFAPRAAGQPIDRVAVKTAITRIMFSVDCPEIVISSSANMKLRRIALSASTIG